MKVSIRVSGLDKQQRMLSKLKRHVFSLRGAMEEIGDEAIKYYQGQGFASQGGVFGERWPKLASSTVRSKIRSYPQYANVPLMRTGRMKESFIKKVGNKQVEITNEASYFKYHQSTASRSRLPRRTMLGINDPIKRMIKEVIEKDIRKQIKVL